VKRHLASLVALVALTTPPASQRIREPHHYLFFGQDREQLKVASSFLESRTIEGAQVVYSWRQLEPEKDTYDFSTIREDLSLLQSKGKRLFIQVQDVTFSPSRVNVPQYLLKDSSYHGGAARQYQIPDDDESRAVTAGWVARRWDPAVQERFRLLLHALGREFDGRIEGINLAESSVDFGSSGRLFPAGFSFEGYRDAIITNLRALRSAFQRSVVLQYANFMPGEWRPTSDKGYLRSVYEAALAAHVGVGGPDLMPFRVGQVKGSYPLIRDAAGRVPTGIAVQDGNLAQVNPSTGERVRASELLRFARDELGVDYVFWGTEEPYYSTEVIPLLNAARP